MAYFSKFPVLQYPVGDSPQNLRMVWVRNLLRRVSLSEELQSGTGIFYSYDIKDGERPEHIAERVYGSPDYHWLVLMCNDIINPYHDWYKSEYALQEYVNKKYGGWVAYITTTNGSFFYDSDVIAGCTLTQGGNSTPITDYQPLFCRVTVPGPELVEGSATIRKADGTVSSVTVQRVDQFLYTPHHFEIVKGTGDVGATDSFVADPLTKQSSSYEYLNGVVGSKTTSLPTVNDGINFAPTGATVDLWETFVGKYMGISGDAYGGYAVSNLIYEMRVNDSKRTIRVLDPRFKKQATKELELLLGV